jgi:hypothetical protein
VSEHSVCELAAQLQQARPIRGWRQRLARPDRLPTCEKNRRLAVELVPEGIFAARCRIELQGNRGGYTELGRASIFSNLKVPRQRVTNRWIRLLRCTSQ